MVGVTKNAYYSNAAPLKHHSILLQVVCSVEKEDCLVRKKHGRQKNRFFSLYYKALLQFFHWATITLGK